MSELKEINRGYLGAIRGYSRVSTDGFTNFTPPPAWVWTLASSGSRVLPAGSKPWLRKAWRVGLFLWDGLNSLGRQAGQAMTILLLVVMSVVVWSWLALYLWVKRCKIPELTRVAAGHVEAFVEQYPFHLYPIVCKSFEFAFLEGRVRDLLQRQARFLELAIGEGTFSARIFPPDVQVVGLDLNPYSLKKASSRAHVKQAVVCDCLRPPIRSGYFDAILANNFLHHVTQKEQTLTNWSMIAPKLIFNESTPYWASGWVIPYLLKRLGLKKRAEALAGRIEREQLQSLAPREALDAAVLKDYAISESVSYMSERTFFLCAIFSFIMRCFGPPTPPHLKRLFLGRRLRRMTVSLTASLAKQLIRFDYFQDRSQDAYVSYVCESRQHFVSRPNGYLSCPKCASELTAHNQCGECGKQYSWMDQMLFLLPNELEHIEREYVPEVAAVLPQEHL